MTPLYQLMGMVAGWNEAASHNRINVFPFNAVLMLGLTVLVGFCGKETFGAIAFGNSPRAAIVSEALRQVDRERNFFTIQGEMVPAETFQQMRSQYASADLSK